MTHENTLYYGDNLKVLRDYIASESVDLIYLDPPFNSSRSYNVLFKDESGRESDAQIKAFDDTWHWGEEAHTTYNALVTDAPERVSTAMQALYALIGTNQMLAYLVMMTARLVELHRVLKPTGSLYLHCDPTASHYLKVILDTIFGANNFRNEIIWTRTSSHNSAKRYGPIHDVILFFSKSESFTWHQQYTAYDEEYINNFYRYVDENGRRYRLSDITGAGIRHGETGQIWRGIDVTSKNRHWMRPPSELEQLDASGRLYWPPKGDMPAYKRYLDEMPGKPLQDIWPDIQPLGAHEKERLGYPTQKPLALLERIIQASSNEGDVVLDPFAGCGTTIAAAHKLGRRWLGIDITHLGLALLKYRLGDMFQLKPGVDFKVIGEPTTVEDARALAADSANDGRYQFQFWALSLVQAKPLGGSEGSKKGKKGADQGVDGVITVFDSGQAQRVLVQVKSGKVKSGDIRDLVGTVEREKAAIGVFLTLEPPSKDMLQEALKAGEYASKTWQRSYRRIQILTIEELLSGKTLDIPAQLPSFKQAVRSEDLPEQKPLL